MEQWERNWKDYYKILQVDFSAEPEVIKAAYKNLVKKYHPDRNSKTGDRMKDLNEASEVLCDPEKKRRYDQEWPRKSGKHADSGRTYTPSPPKKPVPVVEPTDISFRDVSPGKIQKASFIIRNIGGPYKKIGISDPKSWVWVTSYTSLTTDAKLPLKVEIEAKGKDWGRSYSESIRVKLDEEETRIIITLKTRPKPVITVSPAIAGVGILALFIIVSIIVSNVRHKNAKQPQSSLNQIKNGLSQPPFPQRYVEDRTNIISDTVEKDLNGYLVELEQKTGTQMIVLTINTTGGIPIETYAIELATKWKLGQKGKDNGVLIVIAKDDRTYRIEIGRGLEKILPDSFCGTVGKTYFVPNFRKGQFSEGIYQGVVIIGNKIVEDLNISTVSPSTHEPLRNVVARDSNSDVKPAAEDALRKLLKETTPPLGKPYISDFDEIKRVLSCINESIQSRDVDKSCQFLSKEDNNFYSTERKKMEDFINEIQILNSSFDNINISMNEDTANVQYIWNMDFKSKLLGDNVKNNKCMVSLKLKKNGSKWEIFDIKKDSLYSEDTGDTKSNPTKLKQSITPSSHDTVPPKVSSVSPVNGTTDVMVDTSITITFSEAMDASTLNTSNIRLSGGTNGTISHNLINKTSTFTPSSNLSYSTTYTTTVTTGAKDVNGNAMSANYTWNFITISKPSSVTTQSVSTTYCQQCKEEVGPDHICDLTFFCHDCKKEVGDGHICGVTTFCRKCEEETGTGHICDVTYFCYDCEKEVGDDHICGVTHFCPTCKAEASEGHVCGRTYFCFDCEKEMPKEHNHGK